MNDVEEYKNSSKNSKLKNSNVPNSQVSHNNVFIVSDQDIIQDIMVRYLERTS
jgi:hypothetical protein